MPLPRRKSSNADLRRPRSASQSWLDQTLEEIDGSWSDNGDMLNLPGWRTLKYKEFEHDLVVCAELTTEPVQECPCGRPDSEFRPHGRTEPIHVYDLPTRFKRTRIFFRPQRFRCSACGKTTQQPAPGLDERHNMTDRLVKHIEKQSFNIFKTFSAMSEEIGVSKQLIRNMFTARAEQLEKIRRIETPEWLAMDEVYVERKPRCMITAPVNKKVLDMLPSNGQEGVIRWLLQLPKRSTVKIVTIDMCGIYLGAVKRILPQAAVVVDRYHVHNLLSSAIKDVLSMVRDGMSYSERREYMRDPKLLFRSRYNLSKEPEISGRGRPKPCEKHIVDQWLRDVPELATAYQLKEDFSDILDMNERQKAEAEVDLWLERVRKFVNTLQIRLRKQLGGRRNGPFSNVLTSIIMWREYILNYITYKYYFENKPTNGWAESANGQIKKALRLGNDYSFETIRAKAVHGGVSVEKRPKFRLVKPGSRTKVRRKPRRRQMSSPAKNSSSNLVRLEMVRESRDETIGLRPDPKSNKSWAKRFKKHTQDSLLGSTAAMDLPIEVAEPSPRLMEEQTKHTPRRKQETSDQNQLQLSMF